MNKSVSVLGKENKEMDEKQDLRIQKTYLALTNTFLDMLKKKRFEDITVNDLCNQAMVRRATFYKHFADKYEFFTFLVKEIQRTFLEKNINGATQPRQFYVNIVQSMFDFLDQNELLVNSVMQSSMFSIVLDVISEQTALDIKDKLQEDQRTGIAISAPPIVLAQLFTGALMNISKWWIQQNKKIPKEQIIKQTSDLLLHDLT